MDNLSSSFNFNLDTAFRCEHCYNALLYKKGQVTVIHCLCGTSYRIDKKGNIQKLPKAGAKKG